MSWRIYVAIVSVLAVAMLFVYSANAVETVNVEQEPGIDGITVLRLTPQEVQMCREGGGCTLLTEKAAQRLAKRVQQHDDEVMRCRAAVNRDWWNGPTPTL